MTVADKYALFRKSLGLVRPVQIEATATSRYEREPTPRHTKHKSYHKTKPWGRSRNGQKPGEAHPCAKLTDAQVLEMRKLRSEGASYDELMARYNMTRTPIYRAVNGLSFKHLKA